MNIMELGAIGELVPARLVDLPEDNGDKRRKVMSLEAWAAFCGAIRGTRHETFFLLLANAGMRPSEALGLTWSCVDFDRAALRIDKALVRTKAGWKLAPPKNKGSIRTLRVEPELVDALRAQKRTQAEERLLAGGLYENHELVFATAFGQPLHQRNVVMRHFKPALAAAGLDRDHQLRNLRHLFATHAMAAGNDEKAVASFLGHTSTRMLRTVYQQTLDSQIAEVSHSVSARLLPTSD